MTEHLYKYRSFNANDKNTIEVLTKNQIYFSSPLAFNDPFDCVIELSLDGSDEEWLLYILRMVRQFRKDLSQHEQRIEALRLFQSGYRANINKSEATKRLAADLAVYCLSSVNDDILMWSHYANNHTGIVLEFNARKEDLFFRIAQPIVYQERYPTTRLVDTDYHARMVSSILTKSSQWAYEKEYRIIDINDGPGLRIFPEKNLSGVIMGCKMPDSEKIVLKDLVKNHAAKPKLYQAEMAHRSFALNIKEVSY